MLYYPGTQNVTHIGNGLLLLIITLMDCLTYAYGTALLIFIDTRKICIGSQKLSELRDYMLCVSIQKLKKIAKKHNMITRSISGIASNRPRWC